MNTIELEKKHPPLLKQSTNNFTCNNHITESSILKDKATGKVLAVYSNDFLKHKAFSYFNALQGLKFNKSDRTSGISSYSIIFGSAPLDPLKDHPARHVKNEKETNKLWLNLLSHANRFFETQLKDKANEQLTNNKREIKETWLMPGGYFTSGIINKSNQLVFHTDNGNVAEAMSVMFCFKKGVEGGRLFLPEYDSSIEIADGSILLFDGQSVSHGVEKFKKLNSNSERYTIVFYALNGLRFAAETVQEELKNFNKKQLRKIK